MTESEWLECTDPQKMLDFLQGRRAGPRKMRLFAVACCQRISTLLTDKGRKALVAAERFADRLIGRRELHAAWVAVGFPKVQSRQYAASAARGASCSPGYDGTAHAAASAVNAAASRDESRADEGEAYERAAQATLLRDIFGNPFRPSPSLPPAILRWHDATVCRIAQGIYDERRMPEGTLDISRLAILHDALLDAGCDNEELLTHLRSESTHVRGCWALDLILGKE